MEAEARFMVQEHFYRGKPHWDLRLERDGVLKSWAVTKEPDMEPGARRLAILVGDHELDYFGFEGDLGEMGQVKLWDTGWFETEYWGEDKITVGIHGDRLEGRYALVLMRNGKWLFIRSKKPIQRPS